MEPRVCRVLDAIEARDWEGLEGLLAEDVHWTNAVEEDFHGAAAVIEALRHDPPPAPPSWHEVRNGLIVRWIDCPG
jgi:ketosteroid isomerase-like protein